MGHDSGAAVRANKELHQLVPVLHKAAAVSYALDSDLRFSYVNPAWDKFAVENGAPELAGTAVLGTPYLAVIPEVLRPFYSRVVEQVRDTGLVWQHVFECSSPEQFRKFRMRTHLLSSGTLLITNTLVVERAHVIMQGDDDVYAAAGGIISMCAHCRCSRRIGISEQWDFVPAHLALSPARLKVSHGLCPICRAYFYPATSVNS
jgi:hypothetical protein